VVKRAQARADADANRAVPSPCPVPGCSDTVRRGHLLCLADWRRVSARTRAEVWRAWREYRNGKPGSLTRYDGARAAAIREASVRRAARA